MGQPNVYKVLRLSRDQSAAEMEVQLEVNKSYIHRIETSLFQPSEKIKRGYARKICVSMELINELTPENQRNFSFEKMMCQILSQVIEKTQTIDD